MAPIYHVFTNLNPIVVFKRCIAHNLPPQPRNATKDQQLSGVGPFLFWVLDSAATTVPLRTGGDVANDRSRPVANATMTERSGAKALPVGALMAGVEFAVKGADPISEQTT